MRKLYASLKIDITYYKERPIVIRRFPTEFEIKELKQPKYKLVDDERRTIDNELTIKMYKRYGKSLEDVISGGLWNFNKEVPPGVDIDIKMKYSEKRLKDDIRQIAQELSKKHLKPCICYQSRFSTYCVIDNCELTNESMKGFLNDFVKKLEERIELYGINRKEEEIEEIVGPSPTVSVPIRAINRKEEEIEEIVEEEKQPKNIDKQAIEQKEGVHNVVKKLDETNKKYFSHLETNNSLCTDSDRKIDIRKSQYKPIYQTPKKLIFKKLRHRLKEWKRKKEMEQEKKWILSELRIHPYSFELKDRIAEFRKKYPDEELPGIDK